MKDFLKTVFGKITLILGIILIFSIIFLTLLKNRYKFYSDGYIKCDTWTGKTYQLDNDTYVEINQ